MKQPVFDHDCHDPDNQYYSLASHFCFQLTVTVLTQCKLGRPGIGLIYRWTQTMVKDKVSAQMVYQASCFIMLMEK